MVEHVREAAVAAFTRGRREESRNAAGKEEGKASLSRPIAGKKLDERSKRCVRRDPSLPGIVVVGRFAYDLGCRLEGVFVNSSYVATDDKGMSGRALEALGWKTANQQKREALAQAWVDFAVRGSRR